MKKKRQRPQAADTEERKRSVGRARSGRQEMLSASKEELLDLRRESPVSFSGFRVKRKKHGGGLAQLGERLPCKQEVSGSNPLISMKAGR